MSIDMVILSLDFGTRVTAEFDTRFTYFNTASPPLTLVATRKANLGSLKTTG